MGYQIQSRYKSEYMTPEEAQVYESLGRLYCFDPSQAAITDFIPTRVLYDVYLKHADGFDYVSADSPVTLNATQFGVALRRVFAIDPERKCRRTYMGRKEWGYFHVKGAKSVTTYDGTGNPNFRRTSKSPDH